MEFASEPGDEPMPVDEIAKCLADASHVEVMMERIPQLTVSRHVPYETSSFPRKIFSRTKSNI